MFSIELEFANFLRPKFLLGIHVWEWHSDKTITHDGVEHDNPMDGQSIEIGFLLFSININKITESGT